MKSRGYRKLTVSNSAVGLPTLPNDNAPGYVHVRIETARVMYRDDGTDPTTTDGMPLDPGDSLHYNGPLSALKFIRRDASDATAHITYYGNFG